MKWSYAVDEPCRVVVFERKPGGKLYGRTWDRSASNGKGNWRVIALGHKSRNLAKQWAREQAERLSEGEQWSAKVTLSRVFAEYLANETPDKKKAQQKADARRVELFSRFFGNIDPHRLTMADWKRFVRSRASGEIDARGNPVTEGERKAVRARGVEIDLVFLRAVFNWATVWTSESGTALMRFNPIARFPLPKERNPRRPVATQERYETLRKVSDSHTYEARWTGTREKRQSYLSDLLDVVAGTGRRIAAVCALRFQDLRLERTKAAPYGAIVWPADTDKMERSTTAPISPKVRGVLDKIIAERPGIGAAPLFPAPGNPDVPISRHLADKWLREGEKLAGLPHLKGGLWHPYRRKWATERKHLPDVDVAAAGGWKSTHALKQSYQQADDATMFDVVIGGGELRATVAKP